MAERKENWWQRLQHVFYEKKQEPHYNFKKILGLRYHEISDPSVLRALLRDKEHFEGPGFQRKMAEQLIGDALINAEGESWERQRRLFQGFFSAKSVLENIGPLVTEESTAMTNRWLAGNGPVEIDVEQEMRILSGRVIIRAIFGNDMNDADANNIIDMVSHSTIQTIRGLSKFGILMRAAGIHRLWDKARNHGGDMPAYYKSQKYGETKKKIDAILYPLIQKRRALTRQPHDLLGAMLGPAEGKPMSDKEIRDEILMFIVAGHDTTSVGLTYTLLEILKHPDEQQRIQAEVNAITINNKPVEAQDFMKLPSLQKAFKEAVRLHPPSHSVGQEAKADIKIGDIQFKKGDLIRINLPGVLHSATFWPAPDTFKPDRMPAGFKVTHDYLAFGHGPRTCPGLPVSFVEGTLALAEAFSKVSFKIVQEPEKEDHSSFSTRIVGKAVCKVERRVL